MWLELQEYVAAGYNWIIVDEERLVEDPGGNLVMIPYAENTVVRLDYHGKIIECHRTDHKEDECSTYEIRSWIIPGALAMSNRNMNESQFELCLSLLHNIFLVFDYTEDNTVTGEPWGF